MAERVGAPILTEWYSSSDIVLQAKVVGEAYPRFKLTADGVVVTGSGSVAPTALAASGVTYDPTISGLTATNVKTALDEVVARIVELETP